MERAPAMGGEEEENIIIPSSSSRRGFPFPSLWTTLQTIKRIFNISTFRVLSLVSNSLSGNLPSNMGLGLPNLEDLYLSSNNLSRLLYLLFDNNLTNESSLVELSFVTALTECRYLRIISVANNRLTGVLPVSIGKLSSSIEEIYAGGCKMKGRIPKTVGNLSNLRVLGNLTSLIYLYLASDRITSYVPDSLWSLKDLLGFILSSNFLTGSLPSEIGLLKVATWINLWMNQFSNNIPSRIGDLENLNHLSLA
nr:probable leucine-rich repeat receptor-like protein kinase At1g35710 [Coffea arabica]